MTNATVRQLNIFAHLAAAGSVARAAYELNLTPNEVYQGLAILEQSLGNSLFERSGDKVWLTETGRKTAEAMTQLTLTPKIEISESHPLPEFKSNTAQPELRQRQTITLGAPAAVFAHFQDALSAFESTNDDIAISLDIREYLALDASKALKNGQVDLSYFYDLGTPSLAESRYGWSEQISIYCGENHSLVSGDLVSLEMLEMVSQVAWKQDNPLRLLIADAFNRAGLNPISPVLESDDIGIIIAALRENAGYFAAFGPLARDLGKTPGIKRVLLQTALPTIGIWQAVRQNSEQQSPVDALAEFLFR